MVDFPYEVAADSKSGMYTVDTNPWVLEYPDNIEAGDVLVAFTACHASSLDGVWPANWTRIRERGYLNGASIDTAYRVADGTETGTFNWSGELEQGAWKVIRIKGANPEAPQYSDAIAGAGAPNSPSKTPTWGSGKYLWITCCAAYNGVTTTAPTNYSLNFQNLTSGGANGATLGIGQRQLEASVEDPPQFGCPTTRWAALTIVVRPKILSTGTLSVTLDDFTLTGTGEVTTEAVEITPDPATSVVSVVAPEVVEAFYFSPTAATGIGTSIDPSVVEAVYLSPQAVTAISGIVDPDVVEGLYISGLISETIAGTVDPDVIESLYISGLSASAITGIVDPTVYAPYIASGLAAEAIADCSLEEISTPLEIRGAVSSAIVESYGGYFYLPLEIDNPQADAIGGIQNPIVISEQVFYPAPAVAYAGNYAPEVYAPFEITLPSAQALAATQIGSVYTPLTLSDLLPSEAIAETVTGIVYIPLCIYNPIAEAVADILDPEVVIGLYVYPFPADALGNIEDPDILLGWFIVRMVRTTYIGVEYFTSQEISDIVRIPTISSPIIELEAQL